MKSKSLLFLLAVFVSCGNFSKTQLPPIPVEENNVSIGIVDSLYSNTLQEQRKFWVYIPNSFKTSVFTGQKHYPVVYLLDGEAHFHSFTGMLDQLSSQNGNMICPEMMVVGIINTKRTRDFTPTCDCSVDSQSGRADAFANFIEKELIPHINKHYQPDSFRMLVGHSYGGLFTINTFLKQPTAFNAYVALDPSLSWDNSLMLARADSLLNVQHFNSRFLFVAVANTMSTDINLNNVRQDKSPENSHIRAELKFIDMLKNSKISGLNWDYNYYEDEDHYSVPLRGQYDALHYIFRDYPFIAYDRVLDSSVSTDSSMHIIAEHFGYVSRKLNVTLNPPEHFINSIAYSLLREQNFNKALAFFQWNISHYPDSYNVYDSMGDYYLSLNDTVKALQYFKSALQRKDMFNTRKKIVTLSAK